MNRILSFIRDSRAAGAAEFALVLPLFLIFLLGSIDAGRYAWDFNRAAKATQTGARWAVVTDIIPGGDAADSLENYSYAINGITPQGEVVELADFPGVTCTSSGGVASCTCKPGGTCNFSVAVDTAAQEDWNRLVGRMRQIYPAIQSDNVRIDYDWSGLGYSGDPNGPDVAPLTTVSLQNMQFQPLTLLLFGGTIGIPDSAYSLTMEDGDGDFSN
ncbi:TadE/TadG family type IV pilus assembly protein [Altererythrobacter sp. MF3-039]|uniref:TadE/TadG family type IV pilus assembly protein n=1 Tax=Altererythrobacter sp. MF3-039 TaxID=3252901 RepID=UPI00390C8DE0